MFTVSLSSFIMHTHASLTLSVTFQSSVSHLHSTSHILHSSFFFQHLLSSFTHCGLPSLKLNYPMLDYYECINVPPPSNGTLHNGTCSSFCGTCSSMALASGYLLLGLHSSASSSVEWVAQDSGVFLNKVSEVCLHWQNVLYSWVGGVQNELRQQLRAPACRWVM